MKPSTGAGRRAFLQGAAASAVSLALPRAAMAQGSGAEVAVVGAGAAGLAAARTLLAAGRRIVLLEARGRIGGRAHTDEDSVGEPWDRGCSWLHASEVNPWVGYARTNGFETFVDRYPRRIFEGQRPLDAAELTAYRALVERMGRELEEAGRRGLDIPADAAFTRVTREDPWYPLAASGLTSWEGVEPGSFSALDSFQFDRRGDDLLIPKGYGSLLAHYARGVEVRLNTPVSRIRWGRSGVFLDTPAGELRVRCAIVAVPSSVLAAGGMAFDPGLPVAVQEAVHALPLGVMNKVALRFKRNPFAGEDSEVLRERRSGWRGMSYLTRLWSSNVVIGTAAGAFAQELEAAGSQAFVDHALGELVSMAGSDIRRQFDRGVSTAWAGDPWSRGAYSHCVPGRFGARQRLTEPVAERLLFAGEHTEQAAYGTLHGAYQSGIRAARQALQLLPGRSSAGRR